MSTVHYTYRERLIALECLGPHLWYHRLPADSGSRTIGDDGDLVGPFESLDAAWDAARRQIDDRMPEGLRESTDRTLRWASVCCGEQEINRACLDAELARVNPEDRRRIGRYFSHRLANTIQLLSGRLYLYKKEAEPSSCPVFSAAQETVERLEALLLVLRGLGELEFARRVPTGCPTASRTDADAA